MKPINGHAINEVFDILTEELVLKHGIVMAIWYAAGHCFKEETQEQLYDACIAAAADSNPEREVSLHACREARRARGGI